MTTLMVNLASTADTPGSTSAWFALGGALGGVLLTGVIGLTTAILTNRWQTRATSRQLLNEHAGRLRQERRESYAAYWSAWNRLLHQLRELQSQAADLASKPAGAKRPDIDALKEALAETQAKARAAELEWRAAADALFLIAGPEVVEAAERHLQATEARIAEAGKGREASGEDTYRQLNEAMRTEIISMPTVEINEARKPARTRP